MIKRITLLLLICLLIGCATTEVFLPSTLTSAAYGRVTIIREYAEPTAYGCHVYANNSKAAKVANRSYATFALPVGENRIKIDWPGATSYAKADFPVNITENSHRFYAITQKVGVSGLNSYTPVVSVKFKETMRVFELHPDEALKIIRRLKSD